MTWPDPSMTSFQREALLRALPRLFGEVSPELRWSVAIPARNEAERLAKTVDALGAQRVAGVSPFADGRAEALLVLNNCTDGSSELAAALAAERPWLRAVHVALHGDDAHVGRARQLAMDAAAARLLAADTSGVVLTTDADTMPEPTWIEATQAEIEAGADAVGGRALLHAADRAALAPGVRRLYLLDLAYRRALETLCALYAPEPWDPLPRHHHQFGASLAVTARAYVAVGGLPARRTSEDVALVDALRADGWRLRHSPAVRVRTSARAAGRAEGGLADAFAWWAEQVAAGQEPRVEPAVAAEQRLAALGLFAAAHPGEPHPTALRTTPDVPDGQPLPAAIADLRRRIAVLHPLPLAARLDQAARLIRRSAPARARLPLAA